MHKGLDFLLIFGYGLRSSRSKGGSLIWQPLQTFQNH